MSPADDSAQLLKRFGIADSGSLASRSPIDGEIIGHVSIGEPASACAAAAEAFEKWRTVPAPRRGELVRLLGD